MINAFRQSSIENPRVTQLKNEATEAVSDSEKLRAFSSKLDALLSEKRYGAIDGVTTVINVLDRKLSENRASEGPSDWRETLRELRIELIAKERIIYDAFGIGYSRPMRKPEPKSRS